MGRDRQEFAETAPAGFGLVGVEPRALGLVELGQAEEIALVEGLALGRGDRLVEFGSHRPIPLPVCRIEARPAPGRRSGEARLGCWARRPGMWARVLGLGERRGTE